MRALLFTLMLGAFLYTFLPYLNDSRAAANRNEIEALAVQTQLMTPEEVVMHLKQSSRPTMLVVYASWCNYCKKLMPNIHALWGQRKIPGDQMLLVSLDEQYSALSEYLLTHKFTNMLGVPIIIKQQSKSELVEALQSLGADFNGGIPYTGFFGKGGQLLDEIRGVPDAGELEEKLVNLK